MIRREFLYLAAASAAFARDIAFGPDPAFAGEGDSELKTVARDAYLYTLPLIEMENIRARVFTMGGSQNAIYARRVLADHTNRGVTSPNNDTLYASAWLDLTQGPVTINLPELGKRYFSLQLMDFYTNSFAVLGTRTTGPAADTFTLIGPNDAAPARGNIVRAPTARVWALARTLVDGPQDLDAANKVQAAITVSGPKVDRGTQHQTYAKGRAPNASWQDYFAEAGRLLAEYRPPATDLAVLKRIAPLGLGAAFAPEKFAAAEQAAIEAGVTEARALVVDPTGRGVAIDGWYYPGATLGNFGQDYIARAVVARTGLAALPREEAMYMRPTGDDGNALYDGNKAWRIHFDTGKLPPVDAFWSLTMYERTADGQSFFTQNPLNRYAIGDRTTGFKPNTDGSLDIFIGHADPGGERTANWLPAPAGPFTLTLRAYLPKRALLNGDYRLPPMTQA
jgi:hypothetical protein